MKSKRRQPITLSKINPKDTQKIISKYHTLTKNLNKLLSTKEKLKIEHEIEQMGGLNVYQLASLKGGSKEKGFGGSGRWLVKQLQTRKLETNSTSSNNPACTGKINLLDVGAISGEVYTNYKFINTTSIDLNSQSPLVIQQDFFKLQPSIKYDIVCLSLVVNFVSEPDKRGLMLSLVRKHLSENGLFYLVLPLSCVTNSRYFTHNLLVEMVGEMGYSLLT